MEVLVEYDYAAQHPDELSIKKGERIRNVQRKEEGWYEGELTSSGRRGVFPDNFVKPIKPSAVMQKLGINQKQVVKSPENLKKNLNAPGNNNNSNNSNNNGSQVNIGFKESLTQTIPQNGKFNQMQQQQQPIPASSPPPPPPPSTVNQMNANSLNNINNRSNPPLPIKKPLKSIFFVVVLFGFK